jgi:hypothetical protein
VLERTFLMSTGGAGLRHAFGHRVDISASLNELYGVDPRSKQTYHGAFVDGGLHCRLGLGFSQQLELRRFSFSGAPVETGRTVAVLTLWWSPPRGEETRHATVR